MLQEEIDALLGKSEITKPIQLKSFDDLPKLPTILEKIYEAPANDAPQLEMLCHFLLMFRTSLEEKGLKDSIARAMEALFNRKVELFMVDHFNEEQCQKMEWAVPYKDMVLFSKERDILVGHYFVPLTEMNPGDFSTFIHKWMDSTQADPILHFLDFCSGSKNPTFDYYLLSSHPGLSRVLRDKPLLKSLFEKAQPVLKKLSSPTWEKDVRSSLGL
jgi:hypothetical protein